MRWSVYADAQAGLRLCCSQIPEDRFSRVVAQLLQGSRQKLIYKKHQATYEHTLRKFGIHWN